MNIYEELKQLSSGVSLGLQCNPKRFYYGKGARLYSEDDQEFIDFSAGMFTNILGHCHEYVEEKLIKAIKRPWNTHDYSNEDRSRLLEKLQIITPKHIDTFEFYSTGSESIEAGIRCLLSFLPPGRRRLCVFKNAFHGKTLGARGLNGTCLSGERAPNHAVIEAPGEKSTESEIDRAITEASHVLNDGRIGAIVLESIQNGPGVNIISKRFMNSLADICRERDIKIFADEICVGLGRTGKNFAFEHYNLKPDLIAFAKGLGNGYPITALGGRRAMLNTNPYGKPGNASSTFGGNALGLSIALSTMEVYEKEKLGIRAEKLGKIVESKLTTLRSTPQVKIMGYIGLFWAIGIFNDSAQILSDELAIRIHRRCQENGLHFVLFSGMLRFAPALTITESELIFGLDILIEAIKFETGI
ncbi:aspartate aminotransferase family protein [Photorhabdus tasmaniensis]